MEIVKETNTKVWILGLLLSVLFIAAIIWLSLESVHGSDDPADITRKIYIFCGAILFLILFIVFGWRSEKSRIRNFEKKNTGRIGFETDI